MVARYSLQKEREPHIRKARHCIHRQKIAVFCDSEFWHGYNWEERKKDFKSHQEFWIPKIERNMERDAEVTAKLESEGWTVIRFWGNEIKKNTAQCADIIEKAVHSK